MSHDADRNADAEDRPLDAPAGDAPGVEPSASPEAAPGDHPHPAHGGAGGRRRLAPASGSRGQTAVKVAVVVSFVVLVAALIVNKVRHRRTDATAVATLDAGRKPEATNLERKTGLDAEIRKDREGAKRAGGALALKIPKRPRRGLAAAEPVETPATDPDPDGSSPPPALPAASPLPTEAPGGSGVRPESPPLPGLPADPPPTPSEAAAPAPAASPPVPDAPGLPGLPAEPSPAATATPPPTAPAAEPPPVATATPDLAPASTAPAPAEPSLPAQPEPTPAPHAAEGQPPAPRAESPAVKPEPEPERGSVAPKGRPEAGPEMALASPPPRPLDAEAIASAGFVAEAPRPSDFAKDTSGWIPLPNAGPRRKPAADPVPVGPSSSAPARKSPRPPADADVRSGSVLHVVREDEDFGTIARDYYGSSRFRKALWAANQREVPSPDALAAGTTLVIPLPESLDPALVASPGAEPVSIASRRRSRKDDGGPSPLGGGLAPPNSRAHREVVPLDGEPARRPTHLVRPGETLRSIARDTLGDSHRDVEILDLNRRAVRDPRRLPEGIRLALPDDADTGRRLR